jgi:hypothetical protein
LELFEPSGESFSCDRWFLHASALNPLEEDIERRREIVQLNGSAKSACSEPQSIPFRPPPSAPFNDDRETPGEEFLRIFR